MEQKLKVLRSRDIDNNGVHIDNCRVSLILVLKSEIKILLQSSDLKIEFEKEAPLSTSHQFLYKVGNGDVWRLTELVMACYLGKEVSTILEATFNRGRKPGDMKSSDFYYRLQQMNNGRKFLPGGERATLTPEYRR